MQYCCENHGMGKYKGKYAMVAGCHCLRVARLICILVYFRLTVTVKQLINLSYSLNYLYTHTHTHIYVSICLNEYHNRLYCSTSITGISERKVRIMEKMTTSTIWMQLKQMINLNCSFCIYWYF